VCFPTPCSGQDQGSSHSAAPLHPDTHSVRQRMSRHTVRKIRCLGWLPSCNPPPLGHWLPGTALACARRHELPEQSIGCTHRRGCRLSPCDYGRTCDVPSSSGEWHSSRRTHTKISRYRLPRLRPVRAQTSTGRAFRCWLTRVTSIFSAGRVVIDCRRHIAGERARSPHSVARLRSDR